MKLSLVVGTLLVLFVSTTSADFWPKTFGGKKKWKQELKKVDKLIRQGGMRLLRRVASEVDNIRAERETEQRGDCSVEEEADGV